MEQWIFIGVLFVLIVVAFIYLNNKINKNTKTEILVAEKKEDGGYIIKKSNGDTILDL